MSSWWFLTLRWPFGRMRPNEESQRPRDKRGLHLGPPLKIRPVAGREGEKKGEGEAVRPRDPREGLGTARVPPVASTGQTLPASSAPAALLFVRADPVSVADAEILSRHLGRGKGPKAFSARRLAGPARSRQQLGVAGDWPGLRGLEAKESCPRERLFPCDGFSR